jgi:hypothetical protein
MLFNEVINIRNKIGLISESLLIKSKYRKSENVIILNEVPNDVMINTAYLEIIYNIVSSQFGTVRTRNLSLSLHD